ncbi:MAG: energy-coupling factor transporter transmembrane component T [bacterium]|nr:energy-coupling factor transporter transmembrane component T [bacterium]
MHHRASGRPRRAAPLHPAAALAHAGAVLILGMLWSNPAWLAALLALTAAQIISAEGWRAWRRSIAPAAALALSFAVFNVIFSHAGTTLLWRGPSLPLVGEPSVSLEALLFGASAGLRVLVVVSACRLLASLSTLQDALDLLGRAAPKSSFTAALAALLIPRMRRDLAGIREALRARGVRLAGPLPGRILASRHLFRALLVSSLEGSWDIAIALSCRAFGSARRRRPRRRRPGTRDSVIAGCAVAALALALAGAWRGMGSAVFYPVAGPFIRSGGLPLLAAVAVLLSAGFIPARDGA